MRGSRVVSLAGKVVLVAATLLFLSSIGGAMAVAMPFVVPLHWIAARAAVRFEYGVWVLLALLSVWEAAYIYAVLLDPPGMAVAVILVGAAVLSVVFVATTSPKPAAARS